MRDAASTKARHPITRKYLRKGPPGWLEIFEVFNQVCLTPPSNKPWNDDTNVMLEQLEQFLTRCAGEDKRLFHNLFLPDLEAAVAALDAPRVVRITLNFLAHTLVKRAAAEAWQRNEGDARERDGRADLPFDRFCMLWHEISGNPTERARYIAEKAGGNYSNHLNRYYNNRADVDDWDPG